MFGGIALYHGILMVSSGIWKASTDSDKGNYLASGVDLSVVVHT